MTPRGTHLSHDRTLIQVDPGRVSAADLEARINERDRRLAQDTRDDIQRLLGDPPSWRSALAQASEVKVPRGYLTSHAFLLFRIRLRNR